MTDKRSGRDHLEDLSRLKIRLGTLAPIERVIVVRANASQANTLSSTLRLALGRTLHIHVVDDLINLDQILAARQPQLVFVDDQYERIPSAEICLTNLAAAGFLNGVIVATNHLTHARQLALVRLGAADVIDIDDIDVRRLTEAILRACENTSCGE